MLRSLVGSEMCIRDSNTHDRAREFHGRKYNTHDRGHSKLGTSINSLIGRGVLTSVSIMATVVYVLGGAGQGEIYARNAEQQQRHKTKPAAHTATA